MDKLTDAVMPDALSKTVPIWCAVLNRALFPSEPALHPVQFPPNFLTASEEAQIEQRIDGFVRSLKVCVNLMSQLPLLKIFVGAQTRLDPIEQRPQSTHSDCLGKPGLFLPD